MAGVWRYPHCFFYLTFFLWGVLSQGCGGSGGGGDADGVAPTAVFIATPEIGSVPLTTTFDAGGSFDADGTILDYSWDFGDGMVGTGVTTTHTFGEVRDYSVTLTVTDDNGLTGSAFKTISATDRFRINGTAKAPTNTAVDNDLNDVNAPFASNNSFAEAQPIPSPLTLGGYVNVPGAGPRGRSFANGDENDFYAVSLAGGMQLGLYISDAGAGADLDLYLYDQAQTIVDASVGTEAVETLTVPAAGTYFVVVYAYEGASNYTLTIGQKVFSDGPRLWLSDDFVPGEIVARYREGKSGALKRPATVAAAAAALKLDAEAGNFTQEILFRIKSRAERDDVFGALGINGQGSARLIDGSANTDAAFKLDTLLVAKALQKRTDILFASPNYIRKPVIVPDDEFFELQWHYALIQLPQAWELAVGSPDVLVAVVDTGLLMAHPDMQGRLTEGYDFISAPERALDGDGMDPNPDDPGDREPGGSSFHGTHVAGTIAATTNNAQGVAGVTWQTRIMPLRVLGKGGGTLFDVLAAVRYAAGIDNASGLLPERRADIINLSLGGEGFSALEQSVFRLVRDAGVIVVAAAGNGASGAPFYPAAYESVVSVSAVGIDGKLAPYSNFGPAIDVAAPGGDMSGDLNGDGYGDGVLSASGDDSTGTIKMVYSFFQGTSMATAHVTGVAALMKSVYPAVGPEPFDLLLAGGALTDDVGPVGRDDDYGHGVINALSAVREAQALAGGTATLPAALIVTPATLNFGSSLKTIDISARNGGFGSLQVTAVTDDADWLTVSPLETVDGVGTYRVEANRAGLAGGLYSGSILFESTANPVTVRVVMQELKFTGTGNTGFHYILLVEPKTLDTVSEVRVAGAAGRYPFEFENVPYGKYLIYAGSDPNNDGYICDTGEACGAFAALDHPSVLSLSTDLTGIDFGTEFNVDIPTESAATSTVIQPLQRVPSKRGRNEPDPPSQIFLKSDGFR